MARLFHQEILGGDIRGIWIGWRRLNALWYFDVSCYENPFVLAIFIKFNMNQRFRGLRVRSSHISRPQNALINEVIGRQISDERIIHKTLSMHFVKKSYWLEASKYNQWLSAGMPGWEAEAPDWKYALMRAAGNNSLQLFIEFYWLIFCYKWNTVKCWGSFVKVGILMINTNICYQAHNGSEHFEMYKE